MTYKIRNLKILFCKLIIESPQLWQAAAVCSCGMLLLSAAAVACCCCLQLWHVAAVCSSCGMLLLSAGPLAWKAAFSSKICC